MRLDRFRAAIPATLVLLQLAALASGRAEVQATQHYCLRDAVSGLGYQWHIWTTGVPNTYYPDSGSGLTTVSVAAVGASGDPNAFTTELVSSLNAELPAGWSAVDAFTVGKAGNGNGKRIGVLSGIFSTTDK